mmetsp:Transcript_1071/g.2225  ORF Transcript_1071/g.2225 Transcript_1071/m.2225 type:complete len:226 (-) Transcript_1071:791-1468(-)
MSEIEPNREFSPTIVALLSFFPSFLLFSSFFFLPFIQFLVSFVFNVSLLSTAFFQSLLHSPSISSGSLGTCEILVPVSVSFEGVLQGGDGEEDVFGICVHTHQPDAKGLAGSGAETRGDLHFVLGHDPWKNLCGVDALRRDGCHRRQSLVLLLDQTPEADSLQLCIQKICSVLVACPCLLEALLCKHCEGLPEGVEQRDGTSVMIEPGASLHSPIACNLVGIEVP